MSYPKYFVISEGAVRRIAQLKDRLYSEERMKGDEMRDWAQILEAIEESAEEDDA